MGNKLKRTLKGKSKENPPEKSPARRHESANDGLTGQNAVETLDSSLDDTASYFGDLDQSFIDVEDSNLIMSTEIIDFFKQNVSQEVSVAAKVSNVKKTLMPFQTKLVHLDIKVFLNKNKKPKYEFTRTLSDIERFQSSMLPSQFPGVFPPPFQKVKALSATDEEMTKNQKYEAIVSRFLQECFKSPFITSSQAFKLFMSSKPLPKGSELEKDNDNDEASKNWRQMIENFSFKHEPETTEKDTILKKLEVVKNNLKSLFGIYKNLVKVYSDSLSSSESKKNYLTPQIKNLKKLQIIEFQSKSHEERSSGLKLDIKQELADLINNYRFKELELEKYVKKMKTLINEKIGYLVFTFGQYKTSLKQIKSRFKEYQSSKKQVNLLNVQKQKRILKLKANNELKELKATATEALEVNNKTSAESQEEANQEDSESVEPKDQQEQVALEELQIPVEEVSAFENDEKIKEINDKTIIAEREATKKYDKFLLVSKALLIFEYKRLQYNRIKTTFQFFKECKQNETSLQHQFLQKNNALLKKFNVVKFKDNFEFFISQSEGYGDEKEENVHQSREKKKKFIVKEDYENFQVSLEKDEVVETYQPYDGADWVCLSSGGLIPIKILSEFIEQEEDDVEKEHQTTKEENNNEHEKGAIKETAEYELNQEVEDDGNDFSNELETKTSDSVEEEISEV